MRVLRLLLGLLVLLCSFTARAQLARVESLAAPADPTAIATLLDAAALSENPDHDSLHPEGYGPQWFRLTPAPAVAGMKDPVLVLRGTRGARVSFYLPPNYHSQQRYLYGEVKVSPFTRHAMVLDWPHQQSAPLLIRIDDARPLPIRLQFLERADYIREDLGFARRFAAIYTLLTLVAIVALSFWLRLRDRVLPWFVAYNLSQLLYFLAATGDAADVPVLRLAGLPLGQTAVWLGANLVSASSVHFFQGFAELPKHAPRLSRLLWMMCACNWLLALAVVLPWPVDKQILPHLGNGLLLVGNPLSMLALYFAWRGGSRQAGYCLLAWIPLTLASNLFIVAIFARSAPGWVVEMVLPACVVLTSLMLVFALADRMSTLRRERDRAATEAERDGLTGALNRRGIDLRLALALAESRRRREVLAVLFVDIDHFKKVNDQFGHAVGDRCLDNLVSRISSELRAADSLGRYGGEEFLVVLPGAGVPQALAAAERIRADIEFRCREVDGHPVRITVSIGVAVVDPGSEGEAAAPVAAADAALYQAKRAGRNRVVLAGTAGDEIVGAA